MADSPTDWRVKVVSPRSSLSKSWRQSLSSPLIERICQMRSSLSSIGNLFSSRYDFG
jgi:hypothetical protein